MGDIADDIIEGYCCAICGQYFEEYNGHPVACEGCWEEDCGYDKATEKLM